MRFNATASRQGVFSYAIAIGMVVLLGAVLWTPVSAQAGKVGPKDKTERGRFVSYKDGTLTIQAYSGALLGNKLPENTKTLVWDHDKGGKPAVRGDRQHPFIVRNLRAWESHYALRPNVTFFLLDGLRVNNAAFGIYHPDYDAHVYRDIGFENVTAEPLNGGHDEESLAHGDFTFDRLTFKNCLLERDPLIQLNHRASKPSLAGHFRGVTHRRSRR